MKVVILMDIPGTGKSGEIKEVANGFARNYLIPQGKADVATADIIKMTVEQRQAKLTRQQKYSSEIKQLAEQINGKTFTIKAKAGAEQKLFGAITAADIAEELKRVSGAEIDKKKIGLDKPIKKLGTYEVALKLAKDITSKVFVTVEATGE